MKQIISIADFATMLNVINDKIQQINYEALSVSPIFDDEQAKKLQKEQLKEMRKNPVYQSLLHAKKALEECKIEIEVPDLEVEK